MRRQPYFWRGTFYLTGGVALTCGLTLATKSGLGASAIISTPFAVSNAFQIPISVTTFCTYALMTLLQIFIKRKNFSWRDLLQLPLSLIFSSLLGWFSGLFSLQLTQLWQNVILMLIAIVLIGMGAAMMVDMRIVPQAPEGLAQAINEAMNWDLGLAKNLLDLCCVVMALLIDLLFSKKIISVGVGTILAMLLVGRVIFVFNRYCKIPMCRLAGFVDVNV